MAKEPPESLLPGRPHLRELPDGRCVRTADRQEGQGARMQTLERNSQYALG